MAALVGRVDGSDGGGSLADDVVVSLLSTLSEEVAADAGSSV